MSAMVSFGTMILLAITLLVIWATSKLVPFILAVLQMRKAVAGLPSLPSQGVMGTFPFVKKIGRGNLYFYILEETKKKKIKLLVFWRTCLFPFVFVVHPETSRQILRSSEPKNKTFGGSYTLARPWLGDGLLISSNPKWERNRKLLTPAFHFNILQPYVKVYNDAAEIFLEKIQNTVGSSLEVFSPVALLTLDIMLRCACSYDGGIQQQGVSHPYVQAVSRLTYFVAKRVMSPLMYLDTLYYLTSDGREFKKTCDFVHQFAEDIIDKRKLAMANDKDLQTKRHLDFLDILLTARDEDNVGLSKEDIRAEVDTFLFEGHDTTASAISWALYALAKYPDIQETVHQEINKVIGDRKDVDWENLPELQYMTLFLKEVMRMYSPVPSISRMLSKPMTIGGAELPAGMMVRIPLYILHHNPEAWENPEEFRPERFTEKSFISRDPYSYVPFSAGPRNCIGQNFAMNEEKVIIARVVKRFRIEVDPDHEVVMLPELVMRARNGVKLKFTFRN